MTLSSSAARSAAERLIVALDFSLPAAALDFVKRLDGQCRWFKVGLELYLAAGPAIVTALREQGYEVFLDLKLHDIPNTVASAVRVVGPLGASLITVHASGGPEMLRAAQESAANFPNVRLLAVTVLTSMNHQQLAATGVERGAAEQVSLLGRMARAQGIAGLVCSAEETERLRAELPADTLLVVPGIRQGQAPGASAVMDDQQRTATAAMAMQRGASKLVVGRPITRAADPASAVSDFLQEITKA